MLCPCQSHPLLASYVCQQFNATKSSSLWCNYSLWIPQGYLTDLHSTFCQFFSYKYFSWHLNKISLSSQRHQKFKENKTRTKKIVISSAQNGSQIHVMSVQTVIGSETKNLAVSSEVHAFCSGVKWTNHERAAKIWILLRGQLHEQGWLGRRAGSVCRDDCSARYYLRRTSPPVAKFRSCRVKRWLHRKAWIKCFYSR